MEKHSLTESIFGIASGKPREYIDLMISSITLFPSHWIDYSQGFIDVSSKNGELLLNLSSNLATEYQENGSATAVSMINGGIHLLQNHANDPSKFSEIRINLNWKSEIFDEIGNTKDLVGSFSITGYGTVALNSLNSNTPLSLFNDIVSYQLSDINISFKDAYDNDYNISANGNFSSENSSDHLSYLSFNKNNVNQLTLRSLSAAHEPNPSWELKSTGDMLLPGTITGFTGDVIDQITHLTSNNSNLNTKCVYRLMNTHTDHRLYSSNLTEIDTLTGLNIGWTNEGAMYKVNNDTDAQVYRFAVDGNHFYTASEHEKNSILNNPSLSHYNYEGVAFNVFLDPQKANTPLPVMRFFNLDTSSHLYSSAQSEIDTLSDRWINEGIAWYGDSF